MVRSAGGSCQLVAREGSYATLRMRSGEMRRVLSECRATLGEVGNSEHSLRSLGKIKNINTPIFIMHGKMDNIVPQQMGLELFEKANNPKYSYFPEDDDHMMNYNKQLLNEIKLFIINEDVKDLWTSFKRSENVNADTRLKCIDIREKAWSMSSCV